MLFAARVCASPTAQLKTPCEGSIAMERPLLLFASLATGIALATAGCRSCSSNYDYAPPVANAYCDACGTHRCGSNSGGCATGDCGPGGYSTYAPPMGAYEDGGGYYENGDIMPDIAQ